MCERGREAVHNSPHTPEPSLLSQLSTCLPPAAAVNDWKLMSRYIKQEKAVSKAINIGAEEEKEREKEPSKIPSHF